MKLVYLFVLSLLVFSSTANANHYSKHKTYEVTVTNITRGQSFTPILAASHKRSIQFFSVGQASSPEIISLAESGNITPLKTILDNSNKVFETTASEGLLNPGHSTTFTVTGSHQFNRLSLAAMLLPTNDSFVAANSIRLPLVGSKTVLAHAYDAGSEINDELCASIPGPHCGGEALSPNDDGEGYIYISAGVSGEAELSRMQYDWRGAVAKITIKRLY